MFVPHCPFRLFMFLVINAKVVKNYNSIISFLSTAGAQAHTQLCAFFLFPSQKGRKWSHREFYFIPAIYFTSRREVAGCELGVKLWRWYLNWQGDSDCVCVWLCVSVPCSCWQSTRSIGFPVCLICRRLHTSPPSTGMPYMRRRWNLDSFLMLVLRDAIFLTLNI